MGTTRKKMVLDPEFALRLLNDPDSPVSIIQIEYGTEPLPSTEEAVNELALMLAAIG